MRNGFLFLIVLLLPVVDAWACPACAATGNQKYFFQTTIALTVMFLIPLVVSGFVIWRINRIQNAEKHQ